jgi:hypothetical protein
VGYGVYKASCFFFELVLLGCMHEALLNLKYPILLLLSLIRPKLVFDNVGINCHDV